MISFKKLLRFASDNKGAIIAICVVALPFSLALLPVSKWKETRSNVTPQELRTAMHSAFRIQMCEQDIVVQLNVGMGKDHALYGEALLTQQSWQQINDRFQLEEHRYIPELSWRLQGPDWIKAAKPDFEREFQSSSPRDYLVIATKSEGELVRCWFEFMPDSLPQAVWKLF